MPDTQTLVYEPTTYVPIACKTTPCELPACDTLTRPMPSPEATPSPRTPHPFEHQSTTELAVIAMLHDMRNVMSRLECSSALLEPMIEQTSSAPLQELWGLHRRAGLRLYEMAGRLLETAWNNSARHPTPLGPLVEGVCALCRDALHLACVDLEWSIQPDCPPLALHADALSRALHALIENAMDACAETGSGCEQGRVHVRLSHETQPDSLLLSIANNGPSIDPALHDKIFEPRFSTKGSTGLGLSLARRIVEDHGGAVTLTSVPGRTVFRIHLPLSPAAIIAH